MRRWRHRLRIAVVSTAWAMALALTMAACGSSTLKAPANSRVRGGAATFMLLSPSATFIWPFAPAVQDVSDNVEQFQWLMYRPLYFFGNEGVSTTINYPLSMAFPPAYSDGGKTVVINLKGWKWSDGETVDAKDVMFWLNMMKAEKLNYGGYSPGLLPDNLVSAAITGPLQVTMHLNRGYSTYWYTYNQLAEITPMPLAWDVTSLTAAPGSGGCATSVARCAAVYKFLCAQAMDYKSYTTSKLWGTVDGPWRLKAFKLAGGPDTFVPNADYSGNPKPSLTSVSIITKTNDQLIYKAEQAGKTSIGRIASAHQPPRPPGSVLPATNPLGPSWTMRQFWQYSIYAYDLNYNNPVMGPVFRQLYVRQALEYAYDQPGIIAKIWKGYAVPGTGGVPNAPANPWISPAMRANGGNGPYPFNLAKARALLTSHGWREIGGVMTCERPGTSASDCGAGIPAGRTIEFTLDWDAGNTSYPKMFALYQADAARAGIKINLVGVPFLKLFSSDQPCAVGPKCTWDAVFYGFWIFNGPGYEPTGEALFTPGGSGNLGNYNNPVETKLINLTHTSSSLAAFRRYADYTAEQLPEIWMPHLYAIWTFNHRLHGVCFNPLDILLPEYWYWTK